jgi:type I restriction enzyme S subunit
MAASQVNISQSDLKAIPIPVCSYTEQRRIVSRVEELMKLCDALEAKEQLADEQHARLTSTLFEALATSESPQALAENWQRVAEHFDILLDRPEAIGCLEQVVHQLAVRGMLVPQVASEGTGAELLERVGGAAESAAPRGRTQVEQMVEDDAPFPVPTNWAWSRFGLLVDVSGGVTLGRKGAIAEPLTLPYLRVANVQRGYLNLSDEIKSVTIDAKELSRFQLKAGDLLITEGGDWDKVGRTCIWRDEIPTCLHQNHVFRARGLTQEWLPAWGELYLNSSDARAYFAASAKQTTNLASINMTELRGCPFPLPPLAEQRRIVARVEELRRLCAQMREKLTQAREVQARLADALVARANA